MRNFDRGELIGILGIIVLLASWGGLWAAPYAMPPSWVPRVWLLTLAIELPCAVVAGAVAARTASKWWYILAGVAFLSAVVLLADVAV